MTDEQRDQVDINWVQVSASALAAVTSAVLLSTVGVAGTIIGAAIGSLIATAGSAIYQHPLSVTKDRVFQAQAVALQRVARARVSVSGASEDVRRAHDADLHTRAQRAQLQVAQADDELARAEEELQSAGQVAERPPWREVLAGLPWKRIAAVTASIFVAAMLVIVAFETLTGRAVSTYTGGSDDSRRTTIPGLASTGGGSTPAPAEDTEPTDVPSEQPTSGPTIDEQPSEAVEPTQQAQPTDEPTEAPTTSAPTSSPSQTPIPTPPVQTAPTG
jgi:hypothetical protein